MSDEICEFSSFLEECEKRTVSDEHDRSIRTFFYKYKPEPTVNSSTINLLHMAGGRWVVPKHIMEKFYTQKLPDLIKQQAIWNLTEKPHPYGKLFFDFDGSTSELEDLSIIGQTIAECLSQDIYDIPIDVFPAVYVSVSSSMPKHKVHFIIPLIVCHINVRRGIYRHLQQVLLNKGLSVASQSIDLNVTSFRMRHASKVDVKTRLYDHSKGVYGSFVQVWPRDSEPVKHPDFYFCSLSFNDPETPLSNNGLQLLSEHTVKTTREVTYSSTPLTTEQMDDTIEYVSQCTDVTAFKELQISNKWNGHIMKLIRTASGLCPVDTSGTRVHDNQHAWILVRKSGEEYVLGCYCGDYDTIIIKEAPVETLDVPVQRLVPTKEIESIVQTQPIPIKNIERSKRMAKLAGTIKSVETKDLIKEKKDTFLCNSKQQTRQFLKSFK